MKIKQAVIFMPFLLLCFLVVGFLQQERGFQVHPKIQQNLQGKQYALVVGINDYKYVPQLNYAVNDAKAIARLLKDKYSFDEVIQLTSPSSTTRARILQSMDKFTAKLTDKDRFLFYFSGHGKDLEGFGGRKTGYLIPIDGKPDELIASCISMQQIREFATNVAKARHVLFLIDSCFSGLIGKAGRYVNVASLPKASLDQLIQLTSYPGGQVITAGRSTEIASEDDTLGHGYFSYYVLEALGGQGDDDYNGLITVDELFHYVKRKVLDRSNNKQTPQLRFLDRGGDGEFVFVLGKMAEAPLKPTEPEISEEDLEAKRKRLEAMKKSAKEAELAEEAFQVASKLNTVEAWQLFVHDYPNSPRITEARIKLEKLKSVLKPPKTKPVKLSAPPWSMFRGNAQHTGRSPYEGPEKPRLKWTFATKGIVESSPAIGADGTIYVGSRDGKLYAINSDGSKGWEFTIGAEIYSSPAIGKDDTIYVGSKDNKLYAINPDGSKKWEFVTKGRIRSSPAIGRDGTIYVGSFEWDNNLYAINPDGSKKWKFITGNMVESSPAIGQDGTIYLGSCDNKLYAISSNGRKRWMFATRDRIYSSPAIGKDGTIYIGSKDRKLYAINPDGSKKWEFVTKSFIRSSPAIGADGTIYIGSRDNNLYAINPDGSKKWKFATGHDIYSSPAIAPDGTIYVGSNDGKLYAIH